ncbi:MAG: hypothetical protein HC941_00320 [Microcoleus sp. SU_5_3]|nr:hypothetical protein [Microcoleus sp. SU_5_3]
MPKRVFSRTRSPRKRRSEFSTVSDGGIFESRPFVVQSKVGEEGKQKDLKTSLMQAENYGHHLSQIQPTAVSGPIQAVLGKEERIKAKQFNKLKRKEIEEQKQNNKNPVTNAFGSKHLANSGNSLSNQSRKVASQRTWGGGRTSGTSTVVSMNKQQIQDEQRFQIEGLKMNEIRPEDFEAGKLTPRMGVNKPTKFAIQVRHPRLIRIDRETVL